MYRFIPACAGNRTTTEFPRTLYAVHPRVCGEQLRRWCWRPARRGSSPRVRGTDAANLEHQRGRRFIPACAGNSPSGRLQRRAISVHPRVCGEQGFHSRSKLMRYGSSPRVRGTVARPAWCGPTARFIPACAGNSGPTALRSARASVHPRVCGEQLTGEYERLHNSGSSPRVRGTVLDFVLVEHAGRFIPACAGNRLRLECGLAFISVHPRVCGEQMSYGAFRRLATGSSPRVRGTAR